VRLCVCRNKNNVHTIAATATNSLDLKIERREKRRRINLWFVLANIAGFKIDNKLRLKFIFHHIR
jgi:hypothetical protein